MRQEITKLNNSYKAHLKEGFIDVYGVVVTHNDAQNLFARGGGGSVEGLELAIDASKPGEELTNLQ